MYAIVWKYSIRPAQREQFEHEYGPNGTWPAFFRKSNNYKGSFLYKSEEAKDMFLLIDTWADKVSYEDFREANAEAYEQLSAIYASLYVVEEKIGTYTLIE